MERPFPPANVIFDKLHVLKLLVESERKIRPESLDGQEPQAYPATPHGLVKPVFDHAYPDVDNGPKAVVLAGINAVAERIPLRSNSKLLKGLQRTGQCQAPSSFFDMFRETRSRREQGSPVVGSNLCSLMKGRIDMTSKIIPDKLQMGDLNGLRERAQQSKGNVRDMFPAPPSLTTLPP